MGPRPLLLYTTWEVLYMISDQCSYLYRRWRFRRPSSLDILIRVMTDILCWWQRKGTHILAFRHGATTWVKEIILVCNVTARQRSFHWCVYLSTGEGVPCEHYPWCIGPLHSPSPQPWPPGQGPSSMPPLTSSELMWQGPGPPASDICWPSLDTCSNLFTSGPTLTSADIWWQWLLNHLWSAEAGGYAPTGVRMLLLECICITCLWCCFFFSVQILVSLLESSQLTCNAVVQIHPVQLITSNYIRRKVVVLTGCSL